MQISWMTLSPGKLLSVVSLFFAIYPVSAQPAKVEGGVVNGALGGPVSGAKIRLCALPESKTSTAVGICTMAYSDIEGRFVFSKAKAGRFYLAGESAGYLSDNLVQNGRGSSDFELHAGETRSFRLMLWPESSVSGRLVDENGRPLAGVDVSAIREDASLGRRFVSQYQYRGSSSGVSTDKNGEFRICEMKPGRYYLEADIEPWRQFGDPWLKKGYIPAYYPDSPTLATATLLCIGASEQRKVDFHLTPRPAHAVRGRLVVPSDFKRDFDPLWGLRRDDGEYYGQWTDEEFDHRTGAFEMRSVPSGSYNLEIQTGLYDTDLVANRSFIVEDADVNDLKLPMERRFSLKAKVKFPDGFHSSTPYSVLLNLEPDGTTKMVEAGQTISNEGVVTFSRLQQGHHKLYLFTDDPVYIQSARYDDQDVLTKGLSIHGPSAGVLSITLERASAEVNGVVSGDGDVPVAGADVKLITQGDDSPFVFRSVNADGMGRFALKGVPPGRYNLVALNEAVRDWEFGSFEFDQVKRWATEIRVEDVAISGVRVKATTLRFPSTGTRSSRNQWN
jgi:hypothetical protein